jgi:hypothetical protein
MSEVYVHYIALTAGRWQRSETMRGALEGVDALVTKGRNSGNVRGDKRVIVYKFTQTDDHRLDAKSAEMYTNQWGGGPWVEGELWLPAVDDMGGIWYRGEKELVIRNWIELDE